MDACDDTSHTGKNDTVAQDQTTAPTGDSQDRIDVVGTAFHIQRYWRTGDIQVYPAPADPTACVDLSISLEFGEVEVSLDPAQASAVASQLMQAVDQYDPVELDTGE